MQLLPQIVQAALTFRFRLGVEERSGTVHSGEDELIASMARNSVGGAGRGGRGDRARDQLADVEFADGGAEQDGEAVQAAHGFQEGGVAVIPDGPVIILM